MSIQQSATLQIDSVLGSFGFLIAQTGIENREGALLQLLGDGTSTLNNKHIKLQHIKQNAQICSIYFQKSAGLVNDWQLRLLFGQKKSSMGYHFPVTINQLLFKTVVSLIMGC